MLLEGRAQLSPTEHQSAPQGQSFIMSVALQSDPDVFAIHVEHAQPPVPLDTLSQPENVSTPAKMVLSELVACSHIEPQY